MERPDLEALCRLRPDDGKTGSNSTCLVSRLPNTKGYSGLRARSGTELPVPGMSAGLICKLHLSAYSPPVFSFSYAIPVRIRVSILNTSTLKGLDRTGNMR